MIFFPFFSQAYCSSGTVCVRWNKCAKAKGKFAGMCGTDKFYVCCLADFEENPEDFVKGPPPPFEFLVSTPDTKGKSTFQLLLITNINPRVPIIGWLKSLILIATYQFHLCIFKLYFVFNTSGST